MAENKVSRKFLFYSLGLIALVGWLCYANSLSVPFHFDDEGSITKNKAVQAFSLGGIWEKTPTRFLGYFTLALNYHYGQLNPSSYHVLNILIHIGCGFLVFCLALQLFAFARAGLEPRWGCTLVGVPTFHFADRSY